MSAHYTYLLVDCLCLLFPLLFSFHPKIRFYMQWRFFALPCLCTAAFFIAWDILFTHLGVWGFNAAYLYGIRFFNLPLEEVLFFICIPYACVFSYYCFDLFFRLERVKKFVFPFYLLLSVFLLIVAAFHFRQLYTSVTFILLSLFLVYLVWKRASFLPAFFFCFLFILIPFFLSNGVLTGSFFGRVVVWYNDAHNLGLRLLTIPVEDIFYGMLLLLMNVAGYEWLRKRKSDRTV